MVHPKRAEHKYAYSNSQHSKIYNCNLFAINDVSFSLIVTEQEVE